MTVSELIAILQTMPQDYPVEVNSHYSGNVSQIDAVDCFFPEDMHPDFPEDTPAVVIQVNQVNVE